MSSAIRIIVTLLAGSLAFVNAVPAEDPPDSYPPASTVAMAKSAIEEWQIRYGAVDEGGEPVLNELRFLGSDSLSVGRFESFYFGWADESLDGHVVLLLNADSLFGSYVSRAESGGSTLGPGLLGLVNAVIATSDYRRETDSVLVAYQHLFFELAFPVSQKEMVLRNWFGIPAFESNSPPGDPAFRLFDRADFLEWAKTADSTLTDAALEPVDFPRVVGDWRDHFLTCYYWDDPKDQLRVLRSRYRDGTFNWSDARPVGDPFDESSWGR